MTFEITFADDLENSESEGPQRGVVQRLGVDITEVNSKQQLTEAGHGAVNAEMNATLTSADATGLS
jgi:hypothetical protein